MNAETEWQDEWKRLRAERAAARQQWCGAADGLAARARDPLGLGKLLRLHPVVAGGIGAGAAALLVKMFLGRKATADAASPNGDAASGRDVAAPAISSWTTVLRDAAMSVAVPWLLRTLNEKFGADTGAAAAPPSVPEPARAAGGVSPHRPG